MARLSDAARHDWSGVFLLPHAGHIGDMDQHSFFTLILMTVGVPVSQEANRECPWPADSVRPFSLIMWPTSDRWGVVLLSDIVHIIDLYQTTISLLFSLKFSVYSRNFCSLCEPDQSDLTEQRTSDRISEISLKKRPSDVGNGCGESPFLSERQQRVCRCRFNRNEFQCLMGMPKSAVRVR